MKGAKSLKWNPISSGSTSASSSSRTPGVSMMRSPSSSADEGTKSSSCGFPCRASRRARRPEARGPGDRAFSSDDLPTPGLADEHRCLSRQGARSSFSPVPGAREQEGPCIPSAGSGRASPSPRRGRARSLLFITTIGVRPPVSAATISRSMNRGRNGGTEGLVTQIGNVRVRRKDLRRPALLVPPHEAGPAGWPRH